MNNDKLYNLRHSLAHLLAAAVLDIWPETKISIGPVIENGFYYDFDFQSAEKRGQISDNDLPKIEKKMRDLAKTWNKFERREISLEEAKKLFNGNQYKLELIDELGKSGETITTYKSGDFTDLCRGPHVESAKEIPLNAFKLDRLAGAYWRGDEKNKMLTRIYGLAFESKKELEEYENMILEAKKRDHRKIGQELDLFTFSPLVGPGLPLWTPRGTILRDELNNFVWELRKSKGYQKVTIPHITKKDLYEISGHWAKFADDLFKIKTRENKEYALKPMNCPHHAQIFARQQHSYRDMPQRYAETTMVYRDEQSGELGGLTRVLSITQDDAHVFARHSQVKKEFFAIWDIIDTFYKTFNFTLRVRLSFHDPNNFDKYLGTKEIWQKAESALEEIAKEREAKGPKQGRGTNYFIAPGEAAMYGPKLDFLAKDSLGREHQVATVQLDMNMPERFDLTCINEKGEKERIVMIHCAIMGSIERFIAVLLEHTAGVLPVFLSPVQVIVLPIGEGHQKFAKEVHEALKKADIRAEINLDNESLNKKIRNFRLQKIPYAIVIGDKEVESKMLTIETRSGGLLLASLYEGRGSREPLYEGRGSREPQDRGTVPIKLSISTADFIEKLKDEIRNKK